MWLYNKFTCYPIAIGKKAGQTELFNLIRAAGLVKRKALNSKLEECCLRKSVTYWCTILLLSAYIKV